MFLIANIIIILLIIRILFNQKILKSLMEYRWKLLLKFQHIFSFRVYLNDLFTENYFLNMPDLIWSVILNSILILEFIIWSIIIWCHISTFQINIRVYSLRSYMLFSFQSFQNSVGACFIQHKFQ